MDIQISRDIRKFKTKDVGNFSFKQAGFLALGFGAGAGVYFLTGALEIALFPAILIIAIGFIKPFGMTFIQFLRTVGKEKLQPSTYYYETDFEYDLEKLQKEYGEDYHIVLSEPTVQSVPVKKGQINTDAVVYK